MGRVDERRIRMRLERVERLHRGATTSGEREAAAAARDRLLQRLARVRADDPVARFCAEHVAELAVAPEPPPPPERLPDVPAALAILARWEVGDLPTAKVRAWAARLVDRVVLPAEPDADDTPLAEVLLQLASLPRGRLVPSDVPHIRRFLRDRDWSAWFALLERAATRREHRV